MEKSTKRCFWWKKEMLVVKEKKPPFTIWTRMQNLRAVNTTDLQLHQCLSSPLPVCCFHSAPHPIPRDQGQLRDKAENENL